MARERNRRDLARRIALPGLRCAPSRLRMWPLRTMVRTRRPLALLASFGVLPRAWKRATPRWLPGRHAG